MNGNSIFKTPEDEKAYLQLYDAVLAQCTIPLKPLDITTRFGITHINAAGPEAGHPMVLLPGFGANSAMWFPNIPALSRQYRVYAIDTNGQPGRSIPAEKLTAQNSSQWLVEVIDGLGLERAIFVGVSLGGWLALHLAIEHPERTSRVVLLDPAATFEKMSFAFLRHSFLPIMVYPTRPGLTRYFHWMTQGYKVNEQWGELMLRGILNTLPQPPIRAFTFTDADLRQVRVPVLVLIGERSVIYNPQRVYQRATQLVPGSQVEIVPRASHALNSEAAELVNERILKFCQP
jgi:pimeloyl-ACP methyl ester carboxylesterase